MENIITREAAWELLRKYNKDPFHLQHALHVRTFNMKIELATFRFILTSNR